MDGLFEMPQATACICVPFSSVPVEPWCPVHDPHGQVAIAPELRLRDDAGRPLNAPQPGHPA